jgi:S-formylglutathione hydrolase FrmB
LHIGAEYGLRFKGVSAHSAITNIEQMELFAEETVACYRQRDASDEDVLQTIVKNRSTLPALRFDCGSDDLLIKYNRDLHDQLSKQNIPHIYEEFPGEHEWPYWTEHVRRSLRFFADRLNN